MTQAPAEALLRAFDYGQADKRLEVLRHIAQGASISQAARNAGISYKAAWQAIDTLTNLCGVALVDRTVGGAGGGGARITPQGLALLAMAQELSLARQQVLASFDGKAHLAGGLGLRTSMRNQLPCEVLACEALAQGDPMVRIALRTPGGTLIESAVTQESADLLGLAPGQHVLVLCKATAVAIQAGSVPTAGPVITNRLAGRVNRISRGRGRDEVVLTLDGDPFKGQYQWVGFAAHPFRARKGQRAWATVPESALVIGLTA
jgi:molybdate transport system regulatory protein